MAKQKSKFKWVGRYCFLKEYSNVASLLHFCLDSETTFTDE